MDVVLLEDGGLLTAQGLTKDETGRLPASWWPLGRAARWRGPIYLIPVLVRQRRDVDALLEQSWRGSVGLVRSGHPESGVTVTDGAASFVYDTDCVGSRRTSAHVRPLLVNGVAALLGGEPPPPDDTFRGS